MKPGPKEKEMVSKEPLFVEVIVYFLLYVVGSFLDRL